ncbi:SGNH/GDSL hydrolase family protein [Leifsonia sp. RAF41]|uniref:SGNH/GDSL hydrolase family protein n=1 Tax=Leifsonia sp. RAF41 TaxID=3233056 RepID=UPI003F9D1BBD
MVGSVAIAGSAASAVTSTGATASEQLSGKRYVALGDSYAAGYGLPPYAATPAPGCLQSADSIAHRIAATYGLDLSDVSCTGATIANVVSSPQTVAGATVPVQLDAVTNDTTLVTVTIGGNDSRFSSVLSSCVAASPAGPLLQDPTAANCAAQYGSQLGGAIQGVVEPALDGMLAAIRQKAPDAAIIVLGYPALAPSDAAVPAAGCFSSALGTGVPPLPQNAFPFTEVDRSYFAGLSAQLDAAQRASAARNGATFVSVLEASDTHSPCTGSPEPYLNGVTLRSLTPPTLAEGAMHPNAAGASFLTAQLSAAIDEAFPETAAGPTAGQTPPATPVGADSSAIASATGPTGELAATGTDVASATVIGLLALVTGSAALMARRRRRSV